jgi:signal transduction histidine kinase
MTVRSRIVGAFVFIAVVLLSVLTVIAPWRLELEFVEQLRDTASGVAVLLSSRVVAAERGGRDDAIAEAMESALDVPDVVAVQLLDADGNDVTTQGKMPGGLDLPGAGNAFAENDDAIVVQQSVLGASRASTIRVVMSRAGFERRLDDMRSTLALMATIIILVIALGAIVASRFVVRPLEQITKGVRALEKGEIDALTVSAKRGDELYELAEAITRMRTALTESHGELLDAVRRARTRADKLERANVELDRFAYVASHDLRAPLRGIATLSEFIAEDIAGTEGIRDEVHENLALLRRRVRRLDELLMSLLDYSRVGRRSLRNEDVDVRELLEDAIDLLAIPDGFEVVLPEKLPVLETPKAPLRRVFVHLIGNAIKHHDRTHGRVEITYEHTQKYAIFTVTDDGPGIPAEYQDRVFEIFATLKRRDELEGSGMGLALIKKTVETVGGELELASEGRGCVFTVRWPFEFDEGEDKTQHSVRLSQLIAGATGGGANSEA